MKKILLLLFAITVTTSGIVRALSFSIDVGDRPYYLHGPGYWVRGVYWVWVPGHRNRHGVWIHGHYAPR
jgi:hypothetical protein